MAYVTLYRKYRPKTFSDVVGQDVIVKILMNSIVNNKIGHAYIFSGTRGTGKTSVAKIFAKAVNCQSNLSGDVCGKCNICKCIEDNDIDIVEIDAASNNGVEEIREIRNNVKLMPSFARYKVYIIDEVHMLSSSAFNALLKTLEEPPEHVIFVLATTELHKVPATVLSRCQKFDFKKISNNNIIKRLEYILKCEKRKMSNEVVSLIASLSDGGLRDAINLMDQLISLNADDITTDDVYNLLGNISDDIVYDIVDSILDNDMQKGLNIINDLYENGKNFFNITERLQIIIRNIIIHNNTTNYFDKKYDKKLEKYESIRIEDENYLANELFTLSNELKKTNNQKILFEIYFMKMCGFFKKETSLEQTKIVIEDNSKAEVNNKSEEHSEIEGDNHIYKKTRINNTLAEASKEEKVEKCEELKLIKDYLSNKDYNSVASLMTKSILEVASKRNLIFTFKNSFEVVLFDKNIEEIQKLLKLIFGKKYDIVAITTSDWEEIKDKYIKDSKNGIKYVYEQEEKKERKNKNITKLESAAESMFGDDIVTIK